MPIKFRCQHCDQLMGISRSKAGEVVDCPTCGLSVRVPGLDGAVAPIPQPRLNLKDAELADALDELAAIGANVTLDKQKYSEQQESLAAQNSDHTSFPEEAFKAIPMKSIQPPEPPQQLEPAHVSSAPERQATPGGTCGPGRNQSCRGTLPSGRPGTETCCRCPGRKKEDQAESRVPV